MAIYSPIGEKGCLVTVKSKYDNYIGGEWVAPRSGQYFENISPVNGTKIADFPRSQAEDVEDALNAAHKAKDAWGKTSVTERSNILLKMADIIETNLESFAVAETWDNGKAIRESLAADMPLVVDHFRYFAGCIRAQEGGHSEIDEHTVAYHFQEPLGVVGQIIPWNWRRSWSGACSVRSHCQACFYGFNGGRFISVERSRKQYDSVYG